MGLSRFVGLGVLSHLDTVKMARIGRFKRMGKVFNYAGFPS